MNWPRIEPLIYRANPESYFAALRDLPWPIWLDSGRPTSESGRYDILMADPTDTLVIDSRSGESAIANDTSVLLRLRDMAGPTQPPVPGVPFCGGLCGYLGYETGRRWQRQGASDRVLLMPELAVGLYDWAVVVDHEEKTACLAGRGTTERTRERWANLVERFRRDSGLDDASDQGAVSLLDDGFSIQAYKAAFERIQRYIHDGDCYQVNLTRRFHARHGGDAFSLYRRMRHANPAPFGALLDLPFGQVMSASPEQFLHLHEGRVTTRPIKGTRPRGATRAQDTALLQELQSSSKDRAENLMIVDLMRNDLGRVCVPGSIEVSALFSVETYATVHHLVSTVRGQLRAEADAFDLLYGCFPGGSVTGAPKLRAMQIIDELEPAARDIYCGSVFYLGLDGQLDSNISIRTMLKQGDDLYYWSGGGIVADSDCNAEYRESLDKAAAFLALLTGAND